MINETILAEIAAFADMCNFPCSKQDLLDLADDQQAPDEILDVLEDIPMRVYKDESELIEAVQKIAV